ncbi:LOW QUALITY PROTEIN: hypothetical protein HJC23_012146 [Cyclotella cryptica]|uniref:PWWP domain-containing protein n=1 Tax=Cyclotella cryptica TaxID=29204 RepID=A0ABD3PHT7_9STRA
MACHTSSIRKLVLGGANDNQNDPIAPRQLHIFEDMSDDESSSGDDLPLSSLGTGKRKSRGSVNYNEENSQESDEAEFQDGDDDEEARSPNGDGMDTDDFIAEDDDDEEVDEGDDSSSDEGLPLSSLKSAKAKLSTPKNASAKKTKAASSTKKATPKKKESRKASSSKLTKSKSSASSTSSKAVASTYNAPSIELYAKCDKGKLIQAVLVRWWYAYQWPDPETLPKTTPKNYTALDGFPGVYICTSGSDVGKFKDYRDLSLAPSFRNFARKDASELREMLLRAIENQRKALIKMEGEGTGTEKGLRELEKWASKLNCGKADKEAVKVLKSARLVLS